MQIVYLSGATSNVLWDMTRMRMADLTPARRGVIAVMFAGLLLAGCEGAPAIRPTHSEAVTPSGSQALMPIPAHADVLKMFPASAVVLPRWEFATLSGSGLDTDMVARQAVGGGVQWLYVVNPCWWAETVHLTLEGDAERAVADPVLRKAVSGRRAKDGFHLAFGLAPWSVKALRIEPPAVVRGASVVPDEAAVDAVEEILRDVEVMLPHLATRRPNLIRNGTFEEVDAGGFPIGWKLYGWHTADLLCTTEVRESPPGRVLRLDNSKRGRTAGLYTGKFAPAPGREYAFLARMAADRAGLKARLALVGEKYLGQTFVVDTGWREVSLVWPVSQTSRLPQGTKARAEIHNDGQGALFADDVRAVDSTFMNYGDSVAAEQAVADVMKMRDTGSLYRTFAALANPRIVRLAETARKRRVGNEWLLLGPFDSAAGGLNGVYPPEADFLKGADLQKASYVGKENRDIKALLDWTIKNAGAPDYVDLAVSIGPFDFSEGFAFTQIYSDANKRASFLIGSDDGVKVWLNDAAVFTKPGERAAKAGEFNVPVTLKSGWNRVLVKVENIEKDWGFFFSVADERGKRVVGTHYRVQP